MTARLTIRTLGPLQIQLDGQPISAITSRTAEALLVYLMCHKRPLSRAVLADFFWDERDSQRAAANLRTILTMLRKPLGDYLRITRQTVAFDHAADYWLDVEEFEQGMAQLASVIDRPEPPDVGAMTRLDAALAPVQGDFLEGFHLSESRGFEEWLSLMQNHVRRLAERGLQRLVEACLMHGDYHAGIEHADRLLMLDPYNEETHRRMMWLLARSGQHSAALAHFESCRLLLEEEIGAPPDEATIAVYRRIRATSIPAPCRLPPEPTPFVGRTDDVEEIVPRLYLPHCRLLTLLGPGGIGKTRLAIRAAEQLAAQRPGAFLDGIYFVSVADVASQGSFAVAIADALAIPVDGVRTPAEQVLNHLLPRELLLLLDSMEHLAAADEAIALVIDLLAQAPHIKLLVTSRTRLNLQEEWLYDVAGLDYPAAPVSETSLEPNFDAKLGAKLNGELDVGQDAGILAYAAGRLFVQQAMRLQRAFATTSADDAAIVRICRLLEGQPLGLELAAAWTRTHTCGEIADQITHDLDFLDTSLRNVPARHRSLRAVFDYSWSLLADDEQRVMQRLAVFSGPIQAQTAQAVAQASPVQMATLAGKSLLRKLQDADVFAVHDSIRQYALEKLAALPHVEAETWHAYCRYYGAFVAQLAGALHTAEQLEAQAKIHQERNNIRTAWDTAIHRGLWAEIDRMLDGYYWYLWRRGEMHEARTMLVSAVEALANAGGLAEGEVATATAKEANVNAHRLARLQSRLADCLVWIGEYATSRTLAISAEAVLRRAQAWEDLAWVLDVMGQLDYVQGNYGAARRAFEEALTLFRREEVPEGIGHILTTLANVLCDEQADYAGAKPLYTESLAVYRACGDRYGQAKVTINLGSLAHSLGEYEQAKPYYAEGIALCRELNHRQVLAIVLNNMGQVLNALSDSKQAIALLEESADLRRELGDLRGLTFTLMSLAAVAAQLDTHAQARAHFSEALRVGLQLGSPAILADLLVGLADLLAGWRQPAHAAHLLAVVMHMFTEGQEVRQKAGTLLDRLEAEDKEAVAAGQVLAGGQSMADAANQALSWLTFEMNTPAPLFSSA